MIAILGAGIAGSSLAWALTGLGYREVHVYDPHPFGHGSTIRATGGFRTQFVSPLNISLSLASRPFFLEHAEEIDFRQSGYAYVATDEESRHTLDAWREAQLEAGLPIERCEATEVIPGAPFAAGAMCNFCRLDGVFNPERLLRWYQARATEDGAVFHLDCEAPPDLEAEAIVIAAGIWSNEVGREYGIEVKVRNEERSVWIVSGLGIEPDIPLTIDLSSGWAFRERDGKLMVVSPKLPKGDVDAAFTQWLQLRFPGRHPNVDERYECFYEMTPDGHPYVGQASDNVWLTYGFSGHGVMHSPATARSLAAMLCGERPTVDVSALTPSRSESLHEPTNF